MSFYITTAINYVNGVPHLGHAYEAITTDVIARHRRQRGDDVFFLTGTDEHGEPVADAARAEGVQPQELADRNAARFRAMTEQLDISNDYFIRTTDTRHKEIVQEVLQRVHDAGHTYKGIYEGWYCPRCADFKVENEILDGNRCPIHETELVREQEENWFFRLSTFQEPLERLFAERPDFVVPAIRYNEARSFLHSGLEDLSLTRARMTWGVTVPWDPGQVFYVWFDALLNYYTALGYARDGEDLTAHYWPATWHVIGKDILKFHTIFWPAMLMAADIEVPRQVFVHGFLLAADGRKMSKSLGNVLDPFDVLERYGSDALRHYLCREVSFGADGPVGMDAVRARYDSELANEFGNLASRTLNMLGRYCDATVPAVATDPALAADFDGLPARIDELLERLDLTSALDEIWQRVRRLNRYVETSAPWILARDESAREELLMVLASLAEGLRVVTLALNPYIPRKTAELLEALGAPIGGERGFAGHGSGAAVSMIGPLFPKTAD